MKNGRTSKRGLSHPSGPSLSAGAPARPSRGVRPFDPDHYPPLDLEDEIERANMLELDPADDGTPVPDEDAVEQIGSAIGVTYNEDEPLRCGTKELERDRHRWELDPASAEDYRERMRTRGEPDLPAEPLLHMTHRGSHPRNVRS